MEVKSPKKKKKKKGGKIRKKEKMEKIKRFGSTNMSSTFALPLKPNLHTLHSSSQQLNLGFLSPSSSLIMEPVYQGSTSTLSVGFMDRRRRSPLIRRPRDIKGSLHSFTFMPPSSENTLKRKLGGGLTRTIQTNSEAGVYTKSTTQKTMYLGEIHQSMTEKTKRGLKKRLLDQEQDTESISNRCPDDEEIRYLEKLKSKRLTRDYQTNMKTENISHLSVSCGWERLRKDQRVDTFLQHVPGLPPGQVLLSFLMAYLSFLLKYKNRSFLR
ncbi:unnamed protein product [Brassica oleracea]